MQLILLFFRIDENLCHRQFVESAHILEGLIDFFAVLRDPTIASFSTFRQSRCVSNRNVQAVTQHRATFVHCARCDQVSCTRARARALERRRWLVDGSRAQGTGPVARQENSTRRSTTAVKILSLFPRSGRVFLYVPRGGTEGKR